MRQRVGQEATSTTIRTTIKAQRQIRQMWCKPKEIIAAVVCEAHLVTKVKG